MSQYILDEVRAALHGKTHEERAAIKARLYHLLYTPGPQKFADAYPQCCAQAESPMAGRKRPPRTYQRRI